MHETNDELLELNRYQLIVLMRLYDIAMTELTRIDKDVARKLLEQHQLGRLLNPVPDFDGNFLTSELNGNADDNESSQS